jgi:carboxyl-terminal processing protease
LPTAAGAQVPAVEDTLQAAETFDAAWELIRDTYYDPELRGVDWEAVRAELRPRAEAAEDAGALRAVLQEMLSTLGESHFGILPREALAAFADEEGSPDGEVGLQARPLSGEIVVWRVDEDGPAAAAGVGPGWILVSVDDRSLADRIALLPDDLDPLTRRSMVGQVVQHALGGPVGSEARLGLRDGDDREVEVTLTRVAPSAESVQFGNLPPLPVEVEHEHLARDGVEAGLIRFNIWLVPASAPFDEAVDAERDADGIILDLRGNPGGLGAMAMGLAGHFLDEKVSLGTMSTRGTELNFTVNPRRVSPGGARVEPFAGPLAILVDGFSASTSEIFAGGLQAHGRARIFGEPSAGAALPSRLTELPNRDILQHAFADFVDPQGRRLEGRGVIPDTVTPLRREDLLAGRDAALEAALDWIRAQKNVVR